MFSRPHLSDTRLLTYSYYTMGQKFVSVRLLLSKADQKCSKTVKYYTHIFYVNIC